MEFFNNNTNGTNHKNREQKASCDRRIATIPASLPRRPKKL